MYIKAGQLVSIAILETFGNAAYRFNLVSSHSARFNDSLPIKPRAGLYRLWIVPGLLNRNQEKS